MQTVKSSHILKHRDIERIPDIKDSLLRSSITRLVTRILEVGLFNITERPLSNLGGKVEETEVIVKRKKLQHLLKLFVKRFVKHAPLYKSLLLTHFLLIF